ncbi:MAG: serine hydrolase domain-containing protein [Pseudomonadota bacterium]
MGRFLKFVLMGALGLLIWLLWPWYQFEAHSGNAPFLPFGWFTIEGDAPVEQWTGDERYADVGDRVLALAIEHRRSIGAPALSIAVAVEGGLVWQGVTGWADLENRVPASADTQFRIGSTSKAITGTALARLVDQGVMDLDAPLSSYFEAIPNPAWSTITPRQLASHMAGIPHYSENQDLAGLYKTIALDSHYTSMRDALDVFDSSPLLFEPGTEFSYSSLGTVLLGATMAAAANRPYLEIVREEVLMPAQMTSTVVAPAAYSDAGAPDLASFYFRDNDRYRVWRPVDLSHRLPGGGFVSTPTDLVQMGSLVLDEQYLSDATRTAFWTPQRLNDGEVNEQNYAIGWRWREWEIDGIGMVRNANHGGVSRGSQCWLIVFPDYRMSIAMCINARPPEFHEFSEIYDDIIREFVPSVIAAGIPAPDLDG